MGSAMSFGRRLAIACLITLGSRLARAETTLDVQLGWGNQTRTERWVPLFVTASDSRSRNVLLEIDWPHDQIYSQHVSQSFAIGPEPATFPLLIPMSPSAQSASIVLRDVGNGKMLASFDPLNGAGGFGNSITPSITGWNKKYLIGTSGKRSTFPGTGTSDHASFGTGYLDPRLLPTAGIGYDSLDLLVLDQTSFNPLAPAGSPIVGEDAQQAMVDWIRGGGNLLLVPGDDVVPNESPLLDVLPCTIGDRYNLSLSDDTLTRLGLDHRFKTLPARRLLRKSPGHLNMIFGPDFPAIACRRLGLGELCVLPCRLTELQFSNRDTADRFWKPLFQTLHFQLEVGASSKEVGAISAEDQRRRIAGIQITDALGNVPGGNRFGFSYVFIVLIALMLVVGPLDWLVLKALGRQPWTWVTTTGWIFLLTFGAIYAGRLLKSGDLYFRTARLIDQADGRRVADIDLAGLYAPRSASYELKPEPDGWWQPFATTAGFNPGNNPKIDLDFHQTWRENVPSPLWVNVWNLRFLRGDRVASGPALLAASLHELHSSSATATHLAGTITNLTDRTLTDLRVEARGGAGRVKVIAIVGATRPATSPAEESIPPGSTVQVEADLARMPATATDQAELTRYFKAINADSATASAIDAEQFWWLAPTRTAAIRNCLADQKSAAVIFAEVRDPADHPSLSPVPAVEKHWEWVRALVELETVPDQ